MSRLSFAVAFLSVASACLAQVVDPMAYRDDAAAQKAWQAQWDTAPVGRAQRDGASVLRFPCNFRGTRIERATWDRAVSLDMADARGVKFDFYCVNPAPVSGFTLYFESAGGWYSAPFAPKGAGWHTIHLDKQDTRIEGSPAGWSSIRRLRLSAWRGDDADTEFLMGPISLDGAGAPIAILRNDAVARAAPDEARAAVQFSQSMASHLDALGLDYSVLSDGDVTAERLKSRKLVILPHDPALPKPALDALAAYLRDGGRIAAFYALPDELSQATGIDPGPHVRQKAPGQFASIRRTTDAPIDCPREVAQNSWNIRAARPIGNRARIAATWFDQSGQPTGQPALVLSDNCALFTHVLLNDGGDEKRLFLLAMLGHLWPDAWKQASAAAAGRMGAFGPYDGFDAAVKGIRTLASMRPLNDALEKAQSAREAAVRHQSAGEHAQAIASAVAARRCLLDAYCFAQPAQSGEFRAFWCHNAYGPAGMDWDQAIRNLADNGFTAILPNMLWGGVAYYESAVLPVAPEVKTRGDAIAACVAACRKYGVQCHVWKVNWNMSGRAPREFVERMKREGRTQVEFDGSPNDGWLCPSHPENQKLELDSMVEVATKYDVDGIHFDYIRYPDRDGCFCPGCRERFEAQIGRKVANWPADLRRNAALEQQWLDFRRANITRLVAAVHEQINKVKPQVKISAAVFRNLPIDRDGVGQDWQLWCERGYLDFVCPMDYTPNHGEFASMVQRQLPWAGRVPCYPGIGLSTWADRDVVGVIDQINITRSLKTSGFIIFDYQAAEARDIVPMLGKGVTRKAAQGKSE